MDEGGKRNSEIRTDLRVERTITLQFQRPGAHPRLPGRRNGIARGIYNCPVEDDRFSNSNILSGARWRLNAMRSASGPSAYRMVFGPNPADLCGWEDKDEDLQFAQGTSVSGQFAQQ